MKNILFATVRQGNCGDEFILFGTQNIVSSLQPEYNAVIVNKNEEVCRRLQFRDKVLNINLGDLNKNISVNLEEACFKNLPLEDDSFADYYSLDFIDAFFFAGTPEWLVYKLIPLYEKLANFNGPICFLGLGYHEGFKESSSYLNFSEVYKKIHKKAHVFVVRDSLMFKYLEPHIKVDLLPCPALLSSKTQRKRHKLERIGFSLQAKVGDAIGNYVPQGVYYFSLKLLEEVARHYQVEVVCHWIEDLIYLTRELGHKYILRYSYDAKDYLNIYDQYDLVISTRVHGSAMAASLGIPTFTISHSMRTDTVKGFFSQIIALDSRIEDIIENIKTFDIVGESEKIIAHKTATLEAYKKLLSPYFPL